jgi:guanylate kinase
MEDNKSIAPHLVKRTEFEEVLRDYQMSDRAKGVLAKTKLVLLNGPSGTGRNTLIDALVGLGTYHFIVSDTTRPPRVNNGIPEQNGHEYWFRSEQEILEDLKQGEFLEAEIIHDQQVSGISIRELEEATAEGQTPINEVEIGGLQTVLRAKPDTIAIILLPPSFEEWQRRLLGRGTMANSELRNRLETAVRILGYATHADGVTLIINQDIQHTIEQVDALVRGTPSDPVGQDKARTLASDLLEATKKRLAEL